MPLRYQNVVFDLDGTLADTSEGVLEGVRRALKIQNIIENDDQNLRRFIGPPLRYSFSTFYALDAERTEKAVTDYRTFYASEGVLLYRLYFGMKELLEDLKTAGAHLAVATGKPRVFAEILLRHAGVFDYFDAVIGSELDGRLEKKSESITLAMKKISAQPTQTVMIGDRCFDMEGAAQVGIDAIGFLPGFGSEEELRSTGATFIAADVAVLRNLLII